MWRMDNIGEGVEKCKKIKEKKIKKKIEEKLRKSECV